MIRRLFAVVLALAVADGSAAAQRISDEAFAGFIDRAMTNAIGPGFAQLETATIALADALRQLCAAPTEAGFVPVADAFEATVVTWGHVMALPIEPLLTDSRRERFFFWPDPRGLTLRQTQQAILDRDESVTDPAVLRGKSVALQGLGALEYVLYGTGSESITAGDEEGRFRCRYATALAAAMVDIAAALSAETAPGGSFDRLIRTAGPGNPAFSSLNAAMSDLITGAGTSIEYARDALLLPALGEEPAFARPRIAPLWRSGLSFVFCQALVDGTQILLAEGDLAAVLPATATEIWPSISLALDAVTADLALVDVPVETAVTDAGARAALLAAAAAAEDVKTLVRVSLTAALGLSGFNFADGD